MYLNDGELTDAESVLTEKSNTESELSSNYGKLKHSDSLLLLAQVATRTSPLTGSLECLPAQETRSNFLPG